MQRKSRNVTNKKDVAEQNPTKSRISVNIFYLFKKEMRTINVRVYMQVCNCVFACIV